MSTPTASHSPVQRPGLPAATLHTFEGVTVNYNGYSNVARASFATKPADARTARKAIAAALADAGLPRIVGGLTKPDARGVMFAIDVHGAGR